MKSDKRKEELEDLEKIADESSSMNEEYQYSNKIKIGTCLELRNVKESVDWNKKLF